MASTLAPDRRPVDPDDTTAAATVTPEGRADRRRARRRWTFGVVLAVALPRLAVAVMLSALTHRAGAGRHGRDPGPRRRGGLTNWDAAHYLSIVQHGYPTVANAPFFPLQPLLIRAGVTPSASRTPPSL